MKNLESNPKVYRNETEIAHKDFDNISREIIERNSILTFLEEIPLDDLKKIVSFKEINPFSPYDYNEISDETRNRLIFCRKMMYKMEIKI